MKKILLVSAIIINMASVASAQSMMNGILNGLYVSPKLGLSHEKIKDMKIKDNNGIGEYGSDNDSAFSLGIAAGYDFYRNFSLPVRAELEWIYRFKSDWKKRIAEEVLKVETKAHSVSANVYYDLRHFKFLTPYIGFGLGFSAIDSEIKKDKKIAKYKDDFSYNLQIGVNFDLTNHTAVGVGYKYIDLGDGKINKNGIYLSDKLQVHEFMISYKYSF